MIPSNPPCTICKLESPEISFYLPSIPVAIIYKQLLYSGDHYKAAMFLATNKESFNCFCVKCWIDSFVAGSMLDDATTNAYKINSINEHFELAMVETDLDVFWRLVGNPSLN